MSDPSLVWSLGRLLCHSSRREGEGGGRDEHGKYTCFDLYPFVLKRFSLNVMFG